MAVGAGAAAADANFVCRACGGLVPEARRAAHEAWWCPAAAGAGPSAEGAAGESDDDADVNGSLTLQAKTLVSTLYQDEIPVRLSFLPGLDLVFAQNDPHDDEHRPLVRHEDGFTGGSLWCSELVLAEYLGLEAGRPGDRGAAVALGCGAAPVSAMTAAALGWRVLCTDLPEVLPLTRRNANANRTTLALARSMLRAPGPDGGRAGRGACGGAGAAAGGGDGDGDCDGDGDGDGAAAGAGEGLALDVEPLPFGEEIPETTRRWIENRGGAQLVLCSDCIWQAHRHRALAATLSDLLNTRPGSEAFVAYQMRDADELGFFPKLQHYGMRSERLDAAAAARRVCFPRQFGEAIDPAEHFFIHRVVRACD